MSADPPANPPANRAGSSHRWRTLSPARLSPAPRQGLAAVRLIGVLAVLLLLIGGGRFAWVALAPLPEVEVASAGDLPEVPDLPESGLDMRERRDALASLNDDNPYSMTRNFWAYDEPAIPEDETPVAEAGPDEAPPPSTGDRAEQRVAPALAGDEATAAFERLELTEDPTPKVQSMIKKMSLRGVYRVDDRARAMIEDRNTVEAGKGPAIGAYGVGDRLEDDAWTVLAIDPVGKRVALEREGERVALSLFDEQPFTVLASAKQPENTETEAPPRTELRVERLTESEVRAQLREAGLSESEIAEIMELATAEDPSRRRPRTIGPDDEAGEDSEAPAGLRMIMNMLGSDPTQRSNDDEDGS